MSFKSLYALLYFFLVMCSSLHAGIEQYFKKAEGKSSQNQMRNIDCIYMINLDQRPEKFALSLAELQPYGITPYRFSAVNGWELSLETINDVGVKFQPEMFGDFMGTSYLLEDEGSPRHGKVDQIGQNYFCHCMARGSIGIVLSHLSILQDAYDAGFETIWIMEDDIEVIKNPHLVSDLVQELNFLTKGNWDVLFTDQDTKNNKGEYIRATGYALRPNFTPESPGSFKMKKPFRNNFYKIGARFGAYSMIVHRSGMKKILDFIKTYKIFLPYDMDFYLVPGIQLYSVSEDVVSTHINALSDNGGPFYKLNATQTH